MSIEVEVAFSRGARVLPVSPRIRVSMSDANGGRILSILGVDCTGHVEFLPPNRISELLTTADQERSRRQRQGAGGQTYEAARLSQCLTLFQIAQARRCGILISKSEPLP